MSKAKKSEFRSTAPSAEAVFYRSYSRRKKDGNRESFKEAMTRSVNGVSEVGKLNPNQTKLLLDQALNQHTFPSGRAFWVAGSEWSKKQENFYGFYNCSSVHIDDPKTFGLLMDMAMQGTGTGAVLEKNVINKLPEVKNKIDISSVIPLGVAGGADKTSLTVENDIYNLQVGDSRQGWVDAYQTLIDLAYGSHTAANDTINLVLDLSQVRPAGHALKGFGGTANPIKLEEMFRKVASLLTDCYGRKLSSVEVCLLIDEAASCVVAGNIRRSAGMRQGSSDDEQFIHAKENLYSQDAEGNWRVDTKKEALRMANHTVCYHKKPTLDEVKASVQKQFYSGEGAIQYVPEAIARANADLLPTSAAKEKFIQLYEDYGAASAKSMLAAQAKVSGHPLDERELEHRISRYGLNPCAEVVMRDNLCVAGDTPLLLEDRIARIRDVVGQKVKVWNGARFSEVQPYQTGEAVRLYRVTFNDGSYLDVTDQHKFWVKHRFQRKYQELATIDLQELIKTSRYSIYTEDFQIRGASGQEADALQAYTLGLLVGDGRVENDGPSLSLTLYGDKMALPVAADIASKPLRKAGYNVDCTTYRGFSWLKAAQVAALKTEADALLALGSWSRTATLEFVAGLADTDGSNTEANGIRIYLSGYDRAEAVYLLLLRHGIKSSINFAGRAGEQTNKGVRSEDLCYLQITDCADIPCRRLNTSKGRKPACKGKHQIVKSVELLPGLHPTFCFTEPECHKGVFKGTLTGQCNLAEVHLNTLDPKDEEAHYKAFYAAGLQVACLLQHKFVHERIQYSREIDPIVGVSFTGLWDFFVHAFGAKWLDWMFADRPEGTDFERLERQYFEAWKEAAYDGVRDYCTQAGIRVPNRWTVVQPAGSKSLLTGASSGWHPPYAQRFIRRITLGISDPLVSALRDWGYSIVPAPSARDDEGNLLDDINDPRVREVLAEIPTEVSWANLPGVDKYDLNQLSAVAQMRLYMNVQRHYATHTTSATISFRESEIEALAQEIYDSIGTGYIGVALLARFDANATFPRLPFEPISKEKYDEFMESVKAWRLPEDEALGFLGVLKKYDHKDYELVTEAACTSAACIARAEKDEQEGKA